MSNATLSKTQGETLLESLKHRFENNMNRHKGIEWEKIQTRLETHPEKTWSLREMERTGGEPDVVGYDTKTSEYIYYDCCAESPVGRRNICYDGSGQEVREKKDVHPQGNALDMARAMGIELLTEEQY